MKKLLTVAAMCLSIALFAQVSIPKNSKEGVLVLKNNTEVQYRDLTYENGKVTYINKRTNTSEFVYDASVTEVREGTEEISMADSPSDEKLRTKKEIYHYLATSTDPQFVKGKKLNNTGTAFLAGGAACFVVGGILNLSAAGSQVVNNNGEVKSKGSPVPLIIGLAGMGAGLVMKLSGHAQMRKAMDNYQNADAKKFVPVFYVLNNSNGVGLQVKF